MGLKDTEYYDLTKAAQRLNISFGTLVECIRTGQLDACRDKAFPRWRVEKDDLQRFYDKMRKPSDKET